MRVEASRFSGGPNHMPRRPVLERLESIASTGRLAARDGQDRLSFWNRRRVRFVAALFVTTLFAPGCQTGSQATKQTRAESIAPAKGDDTTVLASAGQSNGVVTTAGIGTGASNGAPSPGQTASTGSGVWASLFGRKESAEDLVLPRNDQAAENGATEKAAAGEF
jgi:hypothetical protein